MFEHTTPERLVEAVERASRYSGSGRGGKGDRPAFTIALSREAGARGAEVARALGARLGWPVYDRELLQQIGEQMGLHPGRLESVDEKHKGWLEECLEAFASGSAVSGSVYLRRLVQTLAALGAHGECVIVGRGAAQVLPEASTLRVRLVGPPDVRRDAIRRRLGLGREEAARWVEKTDRERATFVKEYFHKDVADPRGYDLTINSGRFSTDDCADLIADALRRLQPQAASPVSAGER
jgi:cytidylate kinase